MLDGVRNAPSEIVCLSPALPSSVFNPSCESKCSEITITAHIPLTANTLRCAHSQHPTLLSHKNHQPLCSQARCPPLSTPSGHDYRGSLLRCRGCGLKRDTDPRTHGCPALLGPPPCLRPLSACLLGEKISERPYGMRTGSSSDLIKVWH